MVMVAFISDNMLHPNICSPWGDLGTPEGRQLKEQAILAFGEGTLAGDSGNPPGGTPPDTVGIPWMVVVLAGLAIGLIVVVSGASYASKRREG